ncbi:MAG: molecular chaperone DnaJ [Dehalococcoidia bacterium]
MTSKRDYYEVLEVSRSATTEDIKKSFRKLALKYHPDRNKEADAGTRFKEISEAYQVLSDPDRRASYDRFGHAGVNGDAGRGFEGFEGFGGFGDIFDAFFGGSQRQGPRRGNDLEYQVSVSFVDAAFGVDKAVELDRMERCERCKGTRAEKDSDLKTCTTCNGAGRVRRVQRTVFGQFQQVAPCSTCNGEGKIVENPCSECYGRGTVQRHRTMSIEIPAGIDDSSRIRMRGQGEPGALGGEPGDLYVFVRVEQDPVFSRHGDDVLVDIEMNMAHAALGGEISVPTLDGEEDLKVPAGTQSGQVFRIRGKGIPHLGRSERRGDQLVTVRVVTPSKLNDRQRELMKELADSFVGAGASVNGRGDGRGGFFDRIKDAFAGDDQGD